MYTRIRGMFTMVLQDAKHHIVGKFYIHNFFAMLQWVYQNGDFMACMTKVVLVNTQNA